MHPDDLDLLRAASAPSLTPDGSLAVTAVSRPDLASDRYVTRLWVVPVDGSPPRPLTNGPRDSSPEVSPDGTRVAFLRAPESGPPQLAVVALHGGEPVVLTDHKAGAGRPRWSPEGTHLVYGARVPEEGRYGTDEKVGPEAEPPRLVTSNKYKVDGLGYTRDRREHLFVVDVTRFEVGPDGDLPELPVAPQQITDGDHDDQGPAWSPDGAWVAFVSDRHETREDDLRAGAYLVAAGGGQIHALTTGDLSVHELAWVDNQRLALLAAEMGSDGTDFVAATLGLWRLDVPAEGEEPSAPERLTDAGSIDLGEPGTRLAVRGRTALVSARHRGAVVPMRVDLDGGPVGDKDLEEAAAGRAGQRQVGGLAAAGGDDGPVVAVVSTPERLGDLARLDVAGDGPSEPRWLTDLSAPLRATGAVRPLVEVQATSDDGYPVHGWAVLPDPDVHGAGPYPVLLNIHGGPYAMYGWGLFDEAQVYAGAGYAVLMCNPRGSAGYGMDHGLAVRAAFGRRDADDVLGFLEEGLADDRLPLDADRVGVMGGSYGGYMTALLTTRTDRFAAAVVERGYLDAVTFAGSSDIGWFFPQQYHQSPEAMHEQSPMTHVAEVTTPTLVIHSEADWRCPVDQGQRWYAALREQGVEAELLLFPGEGHELSRSGRPKHRHARFEHILRWWQRFLPTDVGAPTP